MSQVNELHNRAMDLAEFALAQRLRGDRDAESELLRQALELERAAIQALGDPIEPTFSVLHRSAGTLALRCGEYRLAEQLAANALAHEPPNEVAEELRDLVEQVHFQRHLELRGVELGNDEFQMSLSGQGVGYGLVPSQELVSRIDDATKLIGRIIERQREYPFSERGVRPSTREDFPVLVSVPRAASFAVTLRVGRPTEQLHFPIATVSQVIVDEFLDLMEILDRADVRALKERIPEPPYLRNFLGIARKIAPDGDRVRQVGFTASRDDEPRSVSVTKPAADIPAPAIVEPIREVHVEAPGRPVVYRGTLRFADARAKDSNMIKLVNVEGRRNAVSVRVPDGMMNDVVRPLWDSRVVVNVLRWRGSTVLTSIELDSEPAAKERPSDLSSTHLNLSKLL